MSAADHRANRVATAALVAVCSPALWQGCVADIAPGSAGGGAAAGGAPSPGGTAASRPGTTPGQPAPGQVPGSPTPGANPAAGPRDPGRVVTRRLNATEYSNTVRDLLGTTLRPGDRFPSDLGGGADFDNNADRLGTSPLFVSLHDSSIDELVEEAFKTARARVLACDPAAGASCIRDLATNFGARAWRRPLVASEIDELVKLADTARTAGATPEEAARTVTKALLLSPNFLFHLEFDANPVSPVPHPVGPYELASRLSYFLWGSMPDDALFAAAKAGRLNDPTELKAQVERMLADGKGQALPASFGGQWLETISIAKHQVAANLFPSFDAALGDAMKREAELVVGSLLRDNRPAADLLVSGFSFLNARLAKHYGLPAPAMDWQRIDLATPQRGGILGLGGVLTATSYPNRTSVVKRGFWVMSSLLCTEPPPAPPDVPPLPEGPTATGTQREILEAHRAKPQCRACHEVIDGIGFALERYSAIGAWRDLDQGRAIDDVGTLPGGATFKGGKELAAVLAKDARFSDCVQRQLTSYALGRTLGAADQPYLADLKRAGAADGDRLRDLLVRVTASDLFRLRRGAPQPNGGTP